MYVIKCIFTHAKYKFGGNSYLKLVIPGMIYKYQREMNLWQYSNILDGIAVPC